MLSLRTSVVLILCMLIPALLAAQDSTAHDRAHYVRPSSGFYDRIVQDADAFQAASRDTTVAPSFRMDFSTVQAPSSVEVFQRTWHQPPVSQGISGMCWCFSATSYYESEVHRLTGKDVKLSELYTVYWEYVEKARRFVRERGNSEFAEGSESNAVPRIWRQYGIVPLSAYSGLLPGQKFHDHRLLIEEMTQYLKGIKASSAWNEEAVLGTIRSILDRYIGKPPATVTVNGKSMSPVQYLANELKLNLDDYVEIMSLMEKPYYTYAEYQVGDNWWHSKEYVNVPLPDFVETIKKALRAGFSICIGGDTSEPGYDGRAGVAVVPTFDIPAAYIDESARQMRFTNHTTTDDHGIHMVGWTTVGSVTWYLIKDSGAGSRNNNHPGYYFWHEDYVKLKMMTFTIHKDQVRALLMKVQPSSTSRGE